MVKTFSKRRLHSAKQRARATRKQGRPKSWTTPLIKKMMVLYLYTDLTNHEILQRLRDTGGGKRSIQEYRKQLLSGVQFEWRPRDAHHMAKRLRRLQACVNTCESSPDTWTAYSNPLSSLSPPLQSPTTTSPIRSVRVSALRFEQIKSNNDGSARMIKIYIDYEDGEKQAIACDDYDVASKCYDIARASFAGMRSDEIPALSVIMTSVNFSGIFIDDSHPLPKELWTPMQRLAMDHCRLTQVPQQIFEFSNLRYLNLRRNWIASISNVSLPHSLEVLDISQNYISALPEDFCNLQQLRTLKVSHNRLRELPPWLGALASLDRFFVDNNPLSMQHYGLVDFVYQRCGYTCSKDASSHCISASTQLLKRLLLQNDPLGPPVYTSPPVCTCSALIAAGTPIDSSYADSETCHDIDQPNLTEDLSETLQNTLFMLTGSARSSATDLTMESLSSVGLAARFSHIETNWKKLLLVHCCIKESEHVQPDCIHRKILDWVSNGTNCVPSMEILQAQDFGGNNALHIAAIWGAPAKVLSLLVRLGCDPCHLNYSSQTACHLLPEGFWSLQNPDVDQFVQCLVDYRFPFHHRDHRGSTMFHRVDLAHEHMHPGLAQYAWYCRRMRNALGELPFRIPTQDEDDGSQGEGAWFACHLGGASSDTHVLPLIPASLVHVLPTRHAAGRNCCEQVETSLHQLALALYRNFRNFNRQMPVPGNVGFTDVFRELLDVCYDINSYNQNGLTALMALVRGLGHNWPRHETPTPTEVEACIQEMLKKGADPNRCDRRGNTALHYAVNYCLPSVVKVLAQNGANVNARNDRGVTVMQLLFERLRDFRHVAKVYTHYQECIVIMLDSGAELDPPFRHWWETPGIADFI